MSSANNPLPPFPLTDDTLLLDNSTIELLRCPRMLEYKWLRRRQLAADAAGRNFGSTLHRGFEVRYRECGSNAITDAVVALQNDAMRKWLDENPQPMMDFRGYDHATKMMRVYNAVYKNEGFHVLDYAGWRRIRPSEYIEKGRLVRWAEGEDRQTRESSGFVAEQTELKREVWDDHIPLVERSFLLPFGQLPRPAFLQPTTGLSKPWLQVYYAGKIDIGIRDNMGVWSFDHKSTFQFGKGWEKQMMVDGGQLGYTWALQQLLGPSIPVMGFVINGIRVRKPKKSSEYNAGDDLSSPIGVMPGDAPIDASDFKRLPVVVTPDVLEDWKQNVLGLIQVILNHYAAGYFPMHRWQCVHKYGICEFYDACHVVPSARENALASTQFEENTWSPLNMVEE